MAAFPMLPATSIEGLSKVIGHTDQGLSKDAITQCLNMASIPLDQTESTKWRFLNKSLSEKQVSDKCSNNILNFLKIVLDPRRNINDSAKYPYIRSGVNRILSFDGYAISASGEIVKVDPTDTLTEARKRTNHLKEKLKERNIHPDILKSCDSELVNENLFHAVLEATKSLSEKIRQSSGLDKDAAELAQQAFGLGKTDTPLIALNALSNESEKSEHKGLAKLFEGAFGAFRNPTAHAPKVLWNITEEDAMDMLTIVSFLHRKLDQSRKTTGTPP